MSWVEQVGQARDQGFVFFDLLTAVDLEAEGFEVVVHLWNPAARKGVTLTTRCPRTEPSVPTITGVFAGAAWHERAVAELFGIRFEGHDTEHLLLSDRFEGHPLRKDFLLAARSAKPWPGAKDPGESDADLATSTRRRPRPPGVPA
jgi:NADH-quinone oxidoreductase subunit C